MLLLKRGVKEDQKESTGGLSGAAGWATSTTEAIAELQCGYLSRCKRSGPAADSTPFLQLNYPNVKDAFYGLRGRMLSEYDFDRIVLAQKYQRDPATRHGAREAPSEFMVSVLSAPQKFDIHRKHQLDGRMYRTDQ